MKEVRRVSLPMRLAFMAAMVLSLLAVGARPSPLHASTPASGTIDGSAPVAWDFAPVGGATVVSNVTGPVAQQCPPVVCDNYDLTLTLPNGATADSYYATNMATLTIQYTWTATADTDLDIFAFSPAGGQHGPGSPDTLAAGANGETLVIGDPLPGVWHIRSLAATAAVPTGAHAVATLTFAPRPSATTGTAQPGDPTFANYTAPSTLLQSSGEPSLGADWSKNNVVMYVGAGCVTCNPTTARVTFNDSVSPPTATWQDVSPTGENKVTTDPIGFYDHSSVGNRWFTTQLAGACSITSFTDNEGANWTPSEGCGPPAGVDHETVGGGPYASPAPTLASYPHAVYYCSQDLITALCSRSDNGGLTFGAPVSIYNLTQCPAGIHGHVKVGPDGTVYVPNRDCIDAQGNNRPGLAVSHDNGQTWSVYTIPDGAPKGQGSDPSVGIGADNTVYYGYQNIDGHPMIAVSHDQGKTWSKSTDVGTPFGTQNMEFAGVVAGDGNRAAFTYLGTDGVGDDQSTDFIGTWHLYVAFTYDAGLTWTTVDATPNDPVQRGCIWDGGGNNQCRNMSDFNDIQIDKYGRVLVAYTDGCSGACETDPNAAPAPSGGTGTYSSIASMLRQTGGKGLFAAYDGMNFGGGTSGNDVCHGDKNGMSKNNGAHCRIHNK